MLDHQKTTLRNGLQLVLVPMPVESVTVLVGVGSGSRDEPAAKAGVSHFLEHMASKGTQKRPTPFAVTSLIDAIGGEQNAGTSKEFTEYYVKVAAKHLETAFDFLSDNLLHPLFPAAEIERERKVIIEEINMYKDLPMRSILDDFELLLYGNNALGRDISGSKQTVDQIKRRDFLAHLKKYYLPSQMVIVVAGKFSKARVKRLIQKYFQFPQRGTVKKRKIIKQDQARARVVLKRKKTDQVHFCFGVPGVAYSSSDRFPVAVLASILGFSRSSRLYREVREKRGLAYYVQAVPEFYSDAGALYARAGVAINKIEEAIKVIQKEYFRITKEPVRAKELQRAKEYLKGRFILDLEDSYSVAGRYAVQAVVEKRLRKPEEVLALIDQVTSKDLLRVAQKLIKPEKFNLALVGPFRSPRRFRRLLRVEI
ncbi:M16 family metallopeptidase [Patescibacteria group bacterium]